MNKTKRKIFFILPMFIILIITAAYFFKHRSSNTLGTNQDIWVNAERVKEMILPIEVTAIGTLVAHSVIITPEIAGHVNAILFRDGSFVKKGTPLIQLDDAIYRAKYESAKAQLTYSEHYFKRLSLLGERGAVSKQAIDQALADLKEKRASMKESEVMVSKMKLYAPFAGIVGQSKVQPGDYVTMGKPLVNITDRKHLHVEYNVPEKFLPLLKYGQVVKIKTQAYPNQIFSGTVAFISPTMNTENHSVLLYAEIANDNDLLAPGMFISVSQCLDGNENKLIIPARSLVPMLEGEQVFKLNHGKVYAATVLTGKRMGENIEIIQGLSANDTIITDGQLKIKNGSSVKIKN